jgi:Xaa-Pro aminopeptidase
MSEIEEKVERLARLAHRRGVGGVLLTTQASFAWLTGGRSNGIDSSTESGNGSLFVTDDGRRYLVADTIEMPRLRDEALAGLGFEPLEYPWTDGQANPAAQLELATRVLRGVRTAVGCDIPMPGAALLAQETADARVPLTAAEAARYRALGRDVGDAIGTRCRALQPGVSELEIARLMTDAVAAVRARAVVMLVGADERIRRFRHPTPTDRSWVRSVMIVICAERGGLVVALTRIVTAGPVDEDLENRTRAAAGVFEALLMATRTGATGAELLAAAKTAYERVGFPGEERLHHQGGAIGYRSREWIAHPTSREVVHPRQAFAWNPSVTGTKVEETSLLWDGTTELLTSSTRWPSIAIEVGGHVLAVPSVLEL